jgi:hypothetical protein
LAPLDRGAVRECLLAALDAAVRGFGRTMVECVLAMRHTAFDRVMGEESDAAEKVESREGMWLQFWRPVSVAREDRAFDTGYWVRRVSPKESTTTELDTYAILAD